MDPNEIEVPATPAPEAPPADDMVAAVTEALKASGAEPTPEAPAAAPVDGEVAELAVEPVEPVVPEVAAEPGPAEPAEAAEPAEPPTADEEAKTLGIRNERARQRFTELRERAAKLDEIEVTLPELQSQAQQYEQMIGHISATGATPEQFQSALGYLAAVNKGSPEQLAKVRDSLRQELEWIEGKLGQSGDVLAAHADLKSAVAAGEVSETYAREIAATRNLQAAQQQHVTQQTQQSQQAQEAQQRAVEDARAQLNSLGQRLQSDPLYAAKSAKAMESFRARLPDIHPSQWATEFLLDYNAVRLEPAPAPKPIVGTVPLRPQGAGAMGRQPATMEEAVMLGLQSMKA